MCRSFLSQKNILYKLYFQHTLTSKTSSTLPRNLPPPEFHSSRGHTTISNRSVSSNTQSRDPNTIGHFNSTLQSSSINTSTRGDIPTSNGGSIIGSLCPVHEAEAVANKHDTNNLPGHDTTGNGPKVQVDSHFSSSSLQSSSSSGSTCASTSTCKLQNSPPSNLSTTVPLPPENTVIQEDINRINREGLTSHMNQAKIIKRNSTAISNASVSSKPQKFTTFCTPEAQIMVSPPPKEFSSTSIIKSPLPSALSSSSSSSGLAGSTISPVSSPTVSFADKPTYS